MRGEALAGTGVADRFPKLVARASLVASLALALGPISPAHAQTPAAGDWRLGAAAGGYAPRSAVIKGADGSHTRLGAGPAFSLDLQYVASRFVSIYGDGGVSFNRITLGSSIRPTVVGPSDQVLLVLGTGGLLLTIPGSERGGARLQPTLRLGGGFKYYSFDLTDTDTQWRLTGDIGVGFRGVGTGGIEVTAEVRFLPSSFDQSKLPTLGIAPQSQRQNDFLFAIGVAIRP